MNNLNVGNALPLKPQPPLFGPCPDCDKLTRWNWRDPSHAGIQEYPGRYTCTACGNVREAVYAHRWLAQNTAKALLGGAPLLGDSEWGSRCLYVLAAPDGFGGHFQIMARELQVEKSTRCRNDWNFMEAVPLRTPRYDLTEGYLLEELALSAGGVLVLDEAGRFRAADVFRLLRSWARMHVAARPHLLMRFHSEPSKLMRTFLQKGHDTIGGQAARPLGCFLAADIDWESGS